MLRYEESIRKLGYKLIAGIDEVGRGALAGPVFASSVILPEGFFSPLIRDSKKLTKLQREKAFALIEREAVSIGIGQISPKEVDEINVYQASKKAMLLAVADSPVLPDHLIIDAMSLPSTLPQEAIIKGDSLSISIAAASIIAKVTRDRLMTSLDEVYPVYGFARNKGYGTLEHRNALKKYGASEIHRKSYKGVGETHK